MMRWHYYGTDPLTGRAESGETWADTAAEAVRCVADERGLVRVAVLEPAPMTEPPTHWPELMRYEYRRTNMLAAVPMTPAEFDRWWS